MRKIFCLCLVFGLALCLTAAAVRGDDAEKKAVTPAQVKTDLTSTAQTLGPTIAFLTPAQTVCNYVSLFFRNISSLLSVGDNHGTTQRFIIIAMPSGPNNEGTPASAPANGPNRDNFLHINPYPFTSSPGQPHECEAGNEPYVPGRQVIGNPPGNQGTLHDTTPQKAR